MYIRTLKCNRMSIEKQKHWQPLIMDRCMLRQIREMEACKKENNRIFLLLSVFVLMICRESQL